jgi:hypothetical protein
MPSLTTLLVAWARHYTSIETSFEIKVLIPCIVPECVYKVKDNFKPINDQESWRMADPLVHFYRVPTR